MFPNPFWQALTTEHSSIALGSDLARRYPADVIPFGGVVVPDSASMLAFRDLLFPGESILTTGDSLPEVPGLTNLGNIPGLQMLLPDGVVIASSCGDERDRIESLGAAEANEMVASPTLPSPASFARGPISSAPTGEFASTANLSPWPASVSPFPVTARSPLFVHTPRI
jgi:hypothetical protein